MDVSSVTVGDTTKGDKVVTKDIDEFFEGVNTEYKCSYIEIVDHESAQVYAELVNKINNTKGASIISIDRQQKEIGFTIFVEYNYPMEEQ